MNAVRIAMIATMLPFFLATGSDAPAPREPAVAGQFYPGDAARLEAAVRGFLADALPARGEAPVALVVPHAGFIYSGQIAADAYRQAMGHPYDVVVLLGTNHTTAGFDAIGVHPGSGFRTPLGVAAIDTRLAADLVAADPGIVFDARVHEREHSVEVQVPFVQVVFPGVTILPVVVGRPDAELAQRFARALLKAMGGRKALVVASSDLSHYPAHEDAVASDAAVLGAVAALDTSALRRAVAAEMRKGRRGLDTCACGEAPIVTAMEVAKALGATRGVVVSYANSGDTALADRDRVVGYGAVAFTRGPAGADLAALKHPAALAAEAPLGAAEKRALLAFARRSIERYLATGTAPLARGLPRLLDRKQGVFVTLRKKGDLRGCIGHMAEDLPLGQATGMMALRAAFDDARFPPLDASELADIEVEVSVLTPLTRVAGPEAVRIGTDGVVIRKSGRSAVFLPEVAVEQGWDRTTLLEHLCAKAGLPADAWKSGAEFLTFQSLHVRESDRL